MWKKSSGLDFPAFEDSFTSAPVPGLFGDASLDVDMDDDLFSSSFLSGKEELKVEDFFADCSAVDKVLPTVEPTTVVKDAPKNPLVKDAASRADTELHQHLKQMPFHPHLQVQQQHQQQQYQQQYPQQQQQYQQYQQQYHQHQQQYQQYQQTTSQPRQQQQQPQQSQYQHQHQYQHQQTQYQHQPRQQQPQQCPSTSWPGSSTQGSTPKKEKTTYQVPSSSFYGPSTTNTPSHCPKAGGIGATSAISPTSVDDENDRKRKRRKYVRQEDVKPTAVTLPRQKLLTMTLGEMDEYIKKMTSTRNLTEDEEQDLKRQRRLVKNRESALASRNRKKEDMEHLEEQVNALTKETTAQKKKISELQGENEALRSQLKSISQLLTGTSSLEISPAKPEKKAPVIKEVKGDEKKTKTKTTATNKIPSKGNTTLTAKATPSSSALDFASSNVGASVTMMVLLVSVGSMIPALDEQPRMIPLMTPPPDPPTVSELGGQSSSQEGVLERTIPFGHKPQEEASQNSVVKITSTPAAASVVSPGPDDHVASPNALFPSSSHPESPVEVPSNEEDPVLIQVYVPRSALSKNSDTNNEFVKATIAAPSTPPPLSPPSPDCSALKSPPSSPRKGVPSMEVSCRIVNVEAPSLPSSPSPMKDIKEESAS